MRGLTVGELIEQLGLYEDDTRVVVEVARIDSHNLYGVAVVESSTGAEDGDGWHYHVHKFEGRPVVVLQVEEP